MTGERLVGSKLPSVPIVGLTFKYSYLWYDEALAKKREGLKDRPCVVVLNYNAVARLGRYAVDVAPITHSVHGQEDGVELHPVAKRRMGLDEDASWIVTTEVNRFFWPGSDVRPVRRRTPSSEAIWNYGILPVSTFAAVKRQIEARKAAGTLAVVPRSG